MTKNYQNEDNLMPINIFIVKNLPKAVVELPSYSRDAFFFLHSDETIDKNFICVKVNNAYHGDVWLCMNTIDIPNDVMTNTKFLKEECHILYAGELKIPSKHDFWNSLNRKRLSEYSHKRIASEILSYIPSQDEQIHVLRIIKLRQLFSQITDCIKEEEDISFTPITRATNFDKFHINNVIMLSGYERESKYLYAGKWFNALQFSPYGWITYLAPEKMNFSVTKTPYPDIVLPAGYIIATDSMIKGELFVLSFAVHPKLRRMGIGSLLFNNMIEESKGKQITINIPDDNFEACYMLRKIGFDAPEVNGSFYIFRKNKINCNK